MAVNAFDILTRSAIITRCLASDISQCRYFVLVRFVEMIVRAFITIRTIATEEVDIAHFYLLHPFDFGLVILNWWINPLAIFIPWYIGDAV